MPEHTNEHMNARRGRGWRCGTWGMSLLCVAGLLLGGCGVEQRKYDAAVAGLEAARTELGNSRARHETLQQENETLRANHEKAASDLEMLSAEIQQIKESRAQEQDLLAVREAESQKAREQAARQLQEIRQAHQQLQSQNRALRDEVRRYEKQLKEAREANKAGQQKERAAASPVAKKRAPKPAPPPVAAPFDEIVAPVNINTSSANDLVLFLGLPKDVADKVVSNRPYRLRGELISKQVLPQATFDVIKDRITAAPQ